MFAHQSANEWYERRTHQTGQRDRDVLQNGEINSQQLEMRMDCQVISKCVYLKTVPIIEKPSQSPLAVKKKQN